jgi:hypothetical protein
MAAADFFYILKMEPIRSSGTSVITISTRRHVPEEGILQRDLLANLFVNQLTLFSHRRNVFKKEELFLQTF